MIELLVNHLWQSTLVCRGRRAPDADAQQEPGARALLAVARRVGEVSRAVRGPDRRRQPVRLAVVVNRRASPTLAARRRCGRPAGSRRRYRTVAPPWRPRRRLTVAAAATSVVLAWLMARGRRCGSSGSGVLALVWTVRWRRVAAVVRRGSPVDAGRELRSLRRLEKIGGVRRPHRGRVVRCPARAGRLRDSAAGAAVAAAHCGASRRRAGRGDSRARTVSRAPPGQSGGGGARDRPGRFLVSSAGLVGGRAPRRRARARVRRRGRPPGQRSARVRGSILRTCQFSIESPRVWVAGVTGSDLKKRIEQILANEARAPLNAWRRILLAHGRSGGHRRFLSRWRRDCAAAARASADRAVARAARVRAAGCEPAGRIRAAARAPRRPTDDPARRGRVERGD